MHTFNKRKNIAVVYKHTLRNNKKKLLTSNVETRKIINMITGCLLHLIWKYIFYINSVIKSKFIMPFIHLAPCIKHVICSAFWVFLQCNKFWWFKNKIWKIVMNTMICYCSGCCVIRNICLAIRVNNSVKMYVTCSLQKWRMVGHQSNIFFQIQGLPIFHIWRFCCIYRDVCSNIYWLFMSEELL